MPSGPAALFGSRLKRGSAYEIPLEHAFGVSNFGTLLQIHTPRKTHSPTNASANW